MRITARLIDSLTVLIDFGAPILNMGVTPSQFDVNGLVPLSIQSQGDEFIVLTLGANLPDGELWVSYQALLGGAQIIRTASNVSSFEVLIGEPSARDSRVYDVDNTRETPTLGDFIDAFSLKEAIEITTGDASATQPDELKFIRAIEDAEALWNSEVLGANAASLLVLSPGKRRTLLTIARYLLDQSGCPRPHVIEAYNEVIRNLRSTTSGGRPEDAYTGADDFFFFGTPAGCEAPACCGGHDSWLA